MKLILSQLRRLFGMFLLRFFVAPSRNSAALFYLTIDILAHIAAADGAISPEEIASIERYTRQHMGTSKERQIDVLRRLRSVRRSPTEFRELVSTLYQAVTGNKILLESVLDVLLDVAHADRVMRPEEFALWKQAAKICRMSEEDISRLLARHKYNRQFDEQIYTSSSRGGSSYHGRSNRQSHRYESRAQSSSYEPQCYRILGASQSESIAAIKRKYRKLAKASHPDKVLHLGAPEEFRKTAEARFREIQSAWEEVCRMRGEI